MKINLFFGSYSLTNNDTIEISKSQANAGKFTTVTIDSTNSWTIPSSIPTSTYGYVIYELLTVSIMDDFGSSEFDGYIGMTQSIYIPPQSTRTIKYVSSGILSINGKNFYCGQSDATCRGQFILVPANSTMVKPIILCTDPATTDTTPTSGKTFTVEYTLEYAITTSRAFVIDNDAYVNNFEYRMDSKPGYTQHGLLIYENVDNAYKTLKAGSSNHTSESIYNVVLSSRTYHCPLMVYPQYIKTYVTPKLDTSTLTVNSDGSVSWSYSFLLDVDSVKDNKPTSCKMKLITDGVSSAYFTPSGYTTDYVSESLPSGKARVTYSGTAESGTIYDSSKKVMTFDQSADAVCAITFKDVTDFTESTVNASIRYIGNHPAFAVSNKCQSIGIFKRPDRDSSGNAKAGLTIGDSIYVHASNHQAMTITGENANVGTMIDMYNSDISGNTVSIGIGIGSGHVNRGIYDNTLGGWSICTQSDKTLHLGTANIGGVISDKYFTANGGLTVTGKATITDRAYIAGETTVANGNLYMSTSSSNQITINQTSQNYNTYNTSTPTYHTLLAKQSNGKTTAYVEHERTSAGNDNISIIARHHTDESTSVLNKISVGRSASANTYSVTDPSAFRAAIGANNAGNINTGDLSYERIRSALQKAQKCTSSSTAARLRLYHSGEGYMTFYTYGSIGVLNAYQVEVSKVATWETITQLASGVRPMYAVRAPLAAAGTPSYNGGVMQVTTSGYVQIYNPESATGNLMLSGSLSFVIAQ